MAGEKDFRAVDDKKTTIGKDEQRPPTGDRSNEAKNTGRGSGAHEFHGLLNFSTFIISLTTSALVNLGELPDPVTNKNAVNLQLARQTISIIEMLRDKTKGNLNADEERLIENVLHDMRMKYVSMSSQG